MIKIELLTAENFKPTSLDNYQRKETLILLNWDMCLTELIGAMAMRMKVHRFC